MRVFAIEIDGPLAQKEAAFMSHLFRAYEGEVEFNFNYPAWAQRINKDWFEVSNHLTEATLVDSFWQDLKCNQEAAQEMSQWAFAGLVPSVICSRPRALRINTELWLAQNYVPYSNLLFAEDDEDISRALRYVDAEFFITTDVHLGVDIVRFNKDIKVYFMRDIYNQAYLQAYKSVDFEIVDSLSQVAEKEGIRTNGS